MYPETDYSKESIMHRMLTRANIFWGLKEINDLDPMVKLMMEALAGELHRLANNINDTQARVLGKVAGLLAPDFLTLPHPAHAIAQAHPAEANEIVDSTTSFSVRAKSSLAQTNASGISFTPVKPAHIFDASIAFTCTGESLFAFDNLNLKQTAARINKGVFPEANTFWLGIKLNPKVKTLTNLAFYFDLGNVEPQLATGLYQTLPRTKWYLNDAELQITPGLQLEQEDMYNSHVFSQHDLLYLLEQDIANYYQHRFVTITNKRFDNITTLQQQYPPSFETIFEPCDLAKMGQQLLWVKVVFPPDMKQEWLNELTVHLNAFPVMNRRLKEIQHTLTGTGNIVSTPATKTEQFLVVQSAEDEEHVYRSIPYRQVNEEETGTYTLRNGGAERFDDRNARELINYVMELVRSESIAFAAYSSEFLTRLQQINQNLAYMEQKTAAMNIGEKGNEIPNSLIVTPTKKAGQLLVKYWLTMTDAANNVRSGTSLQTNDPKIKSGSSVMLTTSVGGKNRLAPQERLHASKYGIQTRDRIITKEDIRSFCKYELGDKITWVKVERGFAVSPNTKEAFMRTIDITITLFDSSAMQKQDWYVLLEQLKIKMQSRSELHNNYRVDLSN